MQKEVQAYLKAGKRADGVLCVRPGAALVGDPAGGFILNAGSNGQDLDLLNARIRVTSIQMGRRGVGIGEVRAILARRSFSKTEHAGVAIGLGRSVRHAHLVALIYFIVCRT